MARLSSCRPSDSCCCATARYEDGDRDPSPRTGYHQALAYSRRESCGKEAKVRSDRHARVAYARFEHLSKEGWSDCARCRIDDARKENSGEANERPGAGGDRKKVRK